MDHDLGGVTAEAFRCCMHEGFTVATEAGPAILTLAGCELLPHRHPDASRDPFALRFEGPATVPLGQQIHELEHPKFGRLGLFLVPIEETNGVRAYEAIFT